MKIKKLSLQKETLLPLDSAEAANIAGGMVPVSTYIPLAGLAACQTGACTDACPSAAGTCATCNTCAGQATCATCGQATCATCNQATCNTCVTNACTNLTCRTDCRCPVSYAVQATCYC